MSSIPYLSKFLPHAILLMKCQIPAWDNKTTQKIVYLFVVSSYTPAECFSRQKPSLFFSMSDRANKKDCNPK